MKVLVLGAGKMVEAILEGLRNETDLSHFYLYSPSGKSAEVLAKKVGVNFSASLDLGFKPDVVWIGCKPQQLKDLATSIQGRYPDSLYVSMLAAVQEDDQRKVLGVSKLVRIMPNLPVRFKKGVTLISSSSASPADIKKIQTVFSLIGTAQVVKENELEELTLLTGSGPALFYEFTKILAASFSSLTELEREKLARMVLLGSGIATQESPEDLSTMIDGVTSKAGVTIAVLEKWRELKLENVVSEGVKGGRKRTEEIKESLRQK